MDFLFALNIEIEKKVPAILDVASSQLDRFLVKKTNGKAQYIFLATQSSYSSKSDTPDGVQYFFDGQCSHQGKFYHSHLLDNEIYEMAQVAISDSGKISNGIYCVCRLARSADGDYQFKVTTDWLGQYPIYYWQQGEKIAISNNISMLAIISNESRSVLPAVENIVSGGSYKHTHLNNVFHLPFGFNLSSDSTSRLALTRRSDHAKQQMSYEETLAVATTEIRAHINALFSYFISANIDPYVVTDITGGSDSRAVLAILLGCMPREALHARCMGTYPSPDANVAALIMHELGINPGCFPVQHHPQDYSIRFNASLSGGARDSGAVLSSVGLKNLVHFKGSFGEIGGATPGVNYLSQAKRERLDLDGAINIFFDRRRRAKATELVTAESLNIVRKSMKSHYEELFFNGVPADEAVAERYLQTRCRTHFGLFSSIENKSRILPEPLANRWLVESRRKLPSYLSEKNKVILDLILQSEHPDLAFYPMANKKWAPELIEQKYHKAFEEMLVVDFKTRALSKVDAPLFNYVRIQNPAPPSYTPLALKSFKKSNAITPQTAHLNGNKAMLNFFVENSAKDDDVWHLIDREKVIASIEQDETEFRQDGIDVNAMGIVASALAWKFGFDVKAKLQYSQDFDPAIEL